ncbi:sigma-70 family RNA polymerase sigma factor [Nonomuraea sp. NPDC050153]|uniref:sigma-70 family RNA polymerase sigma factor n=1 Tax=Nonomuraea sp. NPDC050153 TaxID=3364359 RepID=UPI0037B77A62
MDTTELEPHRAELTGYCYRMLGSGFEAEDAVQETFVRAWRTYDAARGPLRAWLFHLATNICLDMLRGPQRRARAMDLTPAAAPGAGLGMPLPPERWIHPIPDNRLSPEELVVARETVRLAFVAALQHLPPRQRAVLILRDVLKWTAAETAALLSTTVTSVNSALQRARTKLPAVGEGDEEVDEGLLARYVSAFERYDVDGLVSLLHEDATESMPPFTWWLRGREHIRAVMVAAEADAACAGARLVPTRANGSPAFGQYVGGEAFALVVLDVEGGLITGITTYLDPGLFPFFELPMSFDRALRTER